MYGMGELGREDGVEQVVSDAIAVEVTGELSGLVFECEEGDEVADVVVFMSDGSDAGK